MSYSREKIISILNAQKKDIINLLNHIRENKQITFSKNVFIPLTEICKNDCGYCNFKKGPDDKDVIILKDKREILKELLKAEEYGCSEAMFAFGEDADSTEIVRERLMDFGYENMVDYIVDICQMTLDETSLIPHTNGGNFSYQALKRLKEVNGSMGMMLENSSPRLMHLKAHQKSPGKDPKMRLETIANAGRLKIPYTTGILIGIGESKEEIADSLLAIRDLYDKYGHIQEVIVQNFTPTRDMEMSDYDGPTLMDMIRTVMAAEFVFRDSDVSIQVPPNLNYDTAQIFLLCGGDDWGGISPISIDFVNPNSPWPTLEELEKLTNNVGYVLKERLCVYEKYCNSDWLNESILEKINDFNIYQ